MIQLPPNGPPLSVSFTPDANSERDAARKCCCASVLALNFVAAAFHGVQAVAVFALIHWLERRPRSERMFDGGLFVLVRTVPVWRNNTIESAVMESGSIDVLYVIFAFFVLSAVFQCAGGLLSGPAAMGHLRLIEYSFSAAIMMLAIALEAGIRDLYTLQCMFVLIWATQMFGLLADIISNFATRPLQELSECNERKFVAYGGQRVPNQMRRPSYDQAAHSSLRPAWELWLWVLPHVAGWATFLSAYGPAIDIFLQSRAQSERQPPSFVTALIFAELVMFSCFGAVQAYGLLTKTLLCVGWNTNAPQAAVCDIVFGEAGIPCASPTRRKTAASLGTRIDEVDTVCEYAFIVLSLVAKTLLCWIVLAPLLTDRINAEP